MTVEQVIGLTLALLIMAIGCLGSFVPLIPGPPLVLVGAIAHKLYFGPQSAPIWILVGLVLLAALSLVLDSVASSIGAKKLGATWRGMVGAVLGGLIGLFFGLPGILLGPFIGAMVLEMISGRDFENSARAGIGAAIGLIAGALGKFALCVVMIGVFCFSVVYRSGSAM